MEAILYTSNTGYTEHYAKLLSEKTGLPAYPLDKSPLSDGDEIIYMGWLMAGSVKGCKKAAKRYKVKVLCGVGMAETGAQLDDVRKMNQVGDDMPVFTLQGGFDIKKLRGIYKFMMNIMMKTAGKKLSEKSDRTPEEDDMLDLMMNGGDRVSEANLNAVLEWYGSNE